MYILDFMHTYYRNNKDKIISYKNRYYHFKKKTDKKFAIERVLRSRFNVWIRGKHKKVSPILDCGCTKEQLVKHIEDQFEPWMNWSNRYPGHGDPSKFWSIDHIIPFARFNVIKKADQMAVIHYTNLRPARHSENLRKGKNVILV
jgi:hypothetical protein